MYLWPRHGSGLFVSRTCICSLSSRRSRNVLMQFMDSEYNLSAPIRRNLSASTCLTVWCGIHKWCCTIGWPRSYHNSATGCWRIGGSKWRLTAAKVCGRLGFASTEPSWALPKNIWQSVRQPVSQPVSAATCLWVSANDRAASPQLGFPECEWGLSQCLSLSVSRRLWVRVVGAAGAGCAAVKPAASQIDISSNLNFSSACVNDVLMCNNLWGPMTNCCKTHVHEATLNYESRQRNWGRP